MKRLVTATLAEDIGGIRVGQQSPGVVRLVIDLKQAAVPQVFTLPPVAAVNAPVKRPVPRTVPL